MRHLSFATLVESKICVAQKDGKIEDRAHCCLESLIFRDYRGQKQTHDLAYYIRHCDTYHEELLDPVISLRQYVKWPSQLCHCSQLRQRGLIAHVSVWLWSNKNGIRRPSQVSQTIPWRYACYQRRDGRPITVPETVHPELPSSDKSP